MKLEALDLKGVLRFTDTLEFAIPRIESTRLAAVPSCPCTWLSLEAIPLMDPLALWI